MKVIRRVLAVTATAHVLARSDTRRMFGVSAISHSLPVAAQVAVPRTPVTAGGVTVTAGGATVYAAP